jgi:hypothetical protein
VEATIHCIRFSNAYKTTMTPEIISAFNAWRAATHAEQVAQLMQNPARYGITSAADPLLAPPIVARGINWDADNLGWLPVA